MKCNAQSGAIYGIGVLGALVYFLQHALTLTDGIIGVFKAVFWPGNGLLMVTDCTDETELNIQNGQQMLSKGIVAGCRNPLTHNPEYQKKLVDTGLFTEKDCLDMLSMISHLFTRLEKAKLRPVPPVTQTP
jgi:uncharacterized protein (TIGR02391 family)